MEISENNNNLLIVKVRDLAKAIVKFNQRGNLAH
jgi:hypothetical protein